MPRIESQEASSTGNSLSRLRERAGVRAARTLRAASTDAESLLWHHLRARQIQGLKFRRQHPLGHYVLDFVCLQSQLVIEVDGGQHNEPAAKVQDDERSRYINQQGLRVLRFWNHDVLSNIEGVLSVIAEAVGPHPSPLPRAGEGANTPTLAYVGTGPQEDQP